MFSSLPQLWWGLVVVGPLMNLVAGANTLSVDLGRNLRTHDKTFVPDAVLRVTAANISQSCLPAKSTVQVNGTSPGPELRLPAGTTVWIRVYNDMVDQNVTMHWHGLSMAVSPFSDGTPQASQWPIPPMHFFDYEIHVPVKMAGTYFYHSHVGFQAVSAAGPLIVEDKKLPYAYDDEKIIFLSDVFANTNQQIEDGLEASPFVWSGETAMVMVNGKGGGIANNTACNSSLSVIDVLPDKTYRLRFIGGTALTFATIGIQGHDVLTIIEADGSYTKPYNTSYLQIGSGQRFSVLLKTKSVTSGTFSIQVESRERPTLTRGFAVLNYGTKPTQPFFPPPEPFISLSNKTYGFLDYALSPNVPNDFPSAAEVTRRVTMTVHQVSNNGYIIWDENLYPWTVVVPEEPYLVSLYKNDGIEFPSYYRALSNDGLDPVTRAFPARLGEVLEIVIQNTGAFSGGLDAHPFHAHGAHYYDIGSGNGTFNATENEERLKGTSPVLRDTTMLYRYGITTTQNNTSAGWRAWRLRVTEPGVWMIHCHILQHMIMGMQTVWVMGNSTEVLSRVPLPAVAGYLNYGGSVYGNKSHWPTVVEFQDAWAADQ